MRAETLVADTSIKAYAQRALKKDRENFWGRRRTEAGGFGSVKSRPPHGHVGILLMSITLAPTEVEVQ